MFSSIPPIVPARKEMQVLRDYKDALQTLPGVTGVTAAKDGLHIATRSARDSKFLDGLLEDAIDGVAVHFDAAPAVPKPPKPPSAKPKPGPGDGAAKPRPPKPELSPAEKAAKRYGKALSKLPHVTGVSADEQGRLRIGVDDAKNTAFLDGIIEDSLNGVLVQFEAQPA